MNIESFENFIWIIGNPRNINFFINKNSIDIDYLNNNETKIKDLIVHNFTFYEKRLQESLYKYYYSKNFIIELYNELPKQCKNVTYYLNNDLNLIKETIDKILDSNEKNIIKICKQEIEYMELSSQIIDIEKENLSKEFKTKKNDDEYDSYLINYVHDIYKYNYNLDELKYLYYYTYIYDKYINNRTYTEKEIINDVFELEEICTKINKTINFNSIIKENINNHYVRILLKKYFTLLNDESVYCPKKNTKEYKEFLEKETPIMRKVLLKLSKKLTKAVKRNFELKLYRVVLFSNKNYDKLIEMIENYMGSQLCTNDFSSCSYFYGQDYGRVLGKFRHKIVIEYILGKEVDIFYPDICSSANILFEENEMVLTKPHCLSDYILKIEKNYKDNKVLFFKVHDKENNKEYEISERKTIIENYFDNDEIYFKACLYKNDSYIFLRIKLY
jgi:hypothetical protein